MSRRRSREEDSLQETMDSDAQWWQSFGRVVTYRPVTVHGQTYMLQETSFEPPPFLAELERFSRLSGTYLAGRPESSRSRKRARAPASGDATLGGLREASVGDAGLPAECAVCLQDFVAEDKLRVMPCSHAFHQDCIFQWLRVNPVCPLCRHALPTQQEDEDEDYDALPPEQQDDEDEDYSDDDNDPNDRQDDDDRNYQQESTPVLEAA